MSQASITSQQGLLIDKIESMTERMLEELAKPDGQLVITLRCQSKRKANQYLNRETEALEVSATEEDRVLSFPGSGSQDALRFSAPLFKTSVMHELIYSAIFLRVLDLIHEALITGIVTTKRDIYYKDPKLFQNQATVDRCVDNLAFHFGVTRSALNTAAAKGLVAGCFSIIWKSGDETQVRDEVDGMLIPNITDVAFANISAISWILVIEKEATFRTLVSRKFHIVGPDLGILITAKGYPDLSTRAFLRYLSEQPISELDNSSPPIFILVDNDPDGLAIMSTYKYGSAQLSHENAVLVVPRLLWLGVKTTDIITHPDHATLESGFLQLTARDRKKAVDMFESPVFAEDGPEPEWRLELQTMLILNFKAEMQIFGEAGDKLVEYLRERLTEPETDQMLLD